VVSFDDSIKLILWKSPGWHSIFDRTLDSRGWVFFDPLVFAAEPEETRESR